MSAIPKPLRAPKAPKRIARNGRPAKKRKTTLAARKRTLWSYFADYVKERDGNRCFTCDENVDSYSRQAGHFFTAGAHSLIRYEPKNVHVQCARCNCYLRGNAPIYTVRFIALYGQAEFDRLDKLSKVSKRWTRPEVDELIEALKRGGADYECLYAERYGL